MRQGTSTLLAILFLFFTSRIEAQTCTPSAPQVFTNNTPLAISAVGANTVTSTIVVAGAPVYLSDLNLTTFLQHTFTSDLDITLTSPAGTVVTISTDNGSSFDNVFNGTVWNDNIDPGGTVPSSSNQNFAKERTYVNNVVATPLIPEEPLGAFRGEDPNGTWTITIQDQFNLDGGQLTSWSLEISGYANAPTVAMTSQTNNTPVAISAVGANTVTSTINIAGAGTQINAVTLQTFITHTFSSDLDVTLTSPAGTVVSITTDNGSSFDNVFNGTQWSDKADPGGALPYSNNPGVVNDRSFANLVVATPMTTEEALSAFAGEDPNGTWTLTIADQFNLDGGSLDSWTLNIETSTCPLPPGPCMPLAPQVFTNNTPLAISAVGANTVTSTIVVAGAPVYLSDLNLTTFLQHTFTSDLDITLTSPAGTVVTISTDNGSSFDNVFNGTVWNDNIDPGGTVPSSSNQNFAKERTYVNNVVATPLIPEEPLGAFRGEDPNGTWTITIQDQFNLDGGQLTSWSLEISGYANAPMVAMTSQTNNTPVAISAVGANTVTSTINIAGAGTQINAVTLQTFITHTFSSDLDVTLTSPAGTVVSITTDNGGSFDNVFNGTQWSDKADPGGALPYSNNPGVVNDRSFANLVVATPMTTEEALSAFAGEDPNGTWTLTIADQFNLDGGSLDSWTLNIETSLCVAPTCTLTCPANITVSNDPNQCGAVVNYPAPTSSGVCGAITVVPASGSFFPVGTTTVTATSATGFGSCSFTITVNDTQAPTITCPSNITVNNDPNICGAVVNFPAPTITDNCPGATVVSVPASGSVFPVGTTTVTSTVTDASGNTAVCTFDITVNDTQDPTITCPANVTVNNTPGQCSGIATFALPTATDNCAPAGTVSDFSQTWTNTGQRGVFFDITNIGGASINILELSPAMWGATAINDNFSIYFTTSATTWNGNEGNAAAWTLNTTQAVSFPGGALPVQVSIPLTTPLTLGPGQSKGVYVVGTQSFGGGPVAYLSTPAYAGPQSYQDGNLRFTGGIGSGALFGTFFGTGAPTNFRLYYGGITYSSPIGVTQIGGLPSGSVFPVGVTTNTFETTDGSGNTSQCSFTVTVVDNEDPVINCPANMTVTTPIGSCTAVVNYNVTASDNCPGVTTALFSGGASGSAFPLGVNTVTWEATDAAGNTSQCSFTITVLDGQLPVISQQPVNITSCVGSNVTFSVTSTNVVTYQWQTFSGGSWNNIAGANASTHTVNNVTTAMNTNTFRVILQGLCTTVTSNMATLFVNTLPTITLTPSIPPFLTPGQVMSITATGMPPGGNYQWFLNGSPVAGATGNVITGITINEQGNYTVRYTDPNGCIQTSAALLVTGAQSENMWVYPNPNFGQFNVRFFNANPENATVNVYNAKGQKVFTRTLTTTLPYTIIEVDLGPTAANGMYVVELVNGSGRRVGATQVLVRPN